MFKIIEVIYLNISKWPPLFWTYKFARLRTLRWHLSINLQVRCLSSQFQPLSSLQAPPRSWVLDEDIHVFWGQAKGQNRKLINLENGEPNSGRSCRWFLLPWQELFLQTSHLESPWNCCFSVCWLRLASRWLHQGFPR